MGLLDSISAWLKRESSDVGDALDDLEHRLDTDLAEKEQALAASPEDRLETLQDEIADNDGSLDAIRDRIDGATAQADAVADINQTDNE